MVSSREDMVLGPGPLGLVLDGVEEAMGAGWYGGGWWDASFSLFFL